MERFGDKLRRLRADTPQKTVAEALDIPQTTLSSLENQRSIPRGDVLKMLADFFKVPIDYFYDEAKPRASNDALAWLEQVKGGAKGRETVATHSSLRLDSKTLEQIAEKIRSKHNEKNSNKSR